MAKNHGSRSRIGEVHQKSLGVIGHNCAGARSLPHAIAAGLAGNILGLAAAETLARDAKESPALGFFTGQAGIAFVLALVGQKYARNHLAAAGRRLFHAAAEDVVELDLFSGAAGVVWSGCLLASVLHTDWPLRAVEQVAHRLTRSVTEKDGA